MAASKCPKCAHGFEVRDGFGELLPLSHCAACDSYYPAKLGACKWCGTQPERAPIGPYVWKGLGVLTFVAMAWGAWLVHDDPPADVSAARMKAMLKPDSAVQADSMNTSAGSLATASPADSSIARDTTVVVVDAPLAIDSAMQLPVTLAATSDTASPPDPITSQPQPQPQPTPARIEPANVEPAPIERAPVDRAPIERTPAPVKKRPAVRVADRTPARASAPARNRVATKPAPKVAVAKPATKPPAKSRARVVWVNSVARNWVVVRSGASRSARVIASIGPNTRVQLGETKGGWRRIRAKGLAGWVEHRSFFAIADAPRNAGRLAVR
jgi:hypothetical protein